jgi:hypothetical protein
MSYSPLSPESDGLLKVLRELSNRGPIPAVGHGDTSVGTTLLAKLGLPLSSASKAMLHGFVLSARRGTKAKDVNRVNLFAKVSDWQISSLKSSKAILDTYGYGLGNEHRLNCTVSARQPNGQGLYFEIDREHQLLREKHRASDGSTSEVVAWKLPILKERLLASHPATAWIVAIPSERDGVDHFHFRYVTFTARPRVEDLTDLLAIGTVTMDHLISQTDGNVVEKGPLFKIHPKNVDALFPKSHTIDLLRD